MTQEEERKVTNELKQIQRGLDYLNELDKTQQEWLNSEQNKIEYKQELKMREKEYRDNQI